MNALLAALRALLGPSRVLVPADAHDPEFSR